MDLPYAADQEHQDEHAESHQEERSRLLRRELATLARRRGRSEIFENARALETAATASLAPRGVHVNINFYAAPIFALLGAEPAFGPCLFAVGRMAGLVALVREKEIELATW